MAQAAPDQASAPHVGDLVRLRPTLEPRDIRAVGFVIEVGQRTVKVKFSRGQHDLNVGDIVPVTAEEELRLAEKALTILRGKSAETFRRAVDEARVEVRSSSLGLMWSLWTRYYEPLPVGSRRKAGAKAPPGLDGFFEDEHRDVFEQPRSEVPAPIASAVEGRRGTRGSKSRGERSAEEPVNIAAASLAMFGEDLAPSTRREPLPPSEIDALLTAQLAVAWAGESDRLRWWRSELVSEFGGEDLFRRLLPHTWEWAVLQAVREAARRKDVELRGKDHEPDRILSLFGLGFELDERLEERLFDLKRSGRRPQEALPGLKDVVTTRWDKARLLDWVRGHGPVDWATTPTGRRIKGAPPDAPGALAKQLVAALAPLADAFPLPHHVRDVPR